MSKHPRIRELDGIRGIAILMVLIWHYVACQVDLTLLPLVLFPTTVFWSGVDLFFVLSGFLIGGIILDHHNKQNFLKVFWIRRACRILPVLFFLLVMCWLCKSIFDNDQFKWLFENLMPWWSYISFTQNIAMGSENTFGGNFLAITWSLAVEEQFYLLAPVLMIFFGKTIWIRGLLPLVVFAFLLRLSFPGISTYLNLPFRMDSLLLGAFVAVIYREEYFWDYLKRFKKTILILFLILLAITLKLISPNFTNSFLILWFAILYSTFLIVALLYSHSPLTSILRSGLLCFFGSIAYGLYMYHQAVSGLLHGWFRNGASPSLDGYFSLIITISAFFLSVLLAWISYKTFESFFLRTGRKLNYGLDKN